MKRFPSLLLLASVLLTGGEPHSRAQDNVRGGSEPIVSSIDPARLTYDLLVDGNLPQDDPAAGKFRTLPAAYAAAPEGTAAKPTVIGIRPNVYLLPGLAPRGPSLSIRKNYLTLLGLTDDRRTVVLADNRGMMQGADDDGYIIDVNATGFTAKNLTIVNFCNNDYQYPGDPSKNLTRRSDVITQGVALQAAGDRHVYENVALLGRLDTMFLRTTRSYFRNVYIEGTDDWMGGGQISVWEDCTLVFPTGHGVMSASGIVFRRCHFEAAGGMQFYKAEFRSAERPNVLIDCVVPADSPQAPVAWIRGVAAPRPSQLSLTSRTKDGRGNPAVIRDATVGPATFTHSRELSDRERLAYNPWNLLRAAPNSPADDWDPAGAKDGSEAAGQENAVYRIALSGGSPSIRTGGPGATLGATVVPLRAKDAVIAWSTSSSLVTLSRATGPDVTVTGRNATDRAEWVPVRAMAPNGFYVTAYVRVEPTYLPPPVLTAGPAVTFPSVGFARVDYTLELGGKEDQSLVSWFLCDDAAGSHPRKIAVSRGDLPLRTLPLEPGFIGKFLKVTVEPKHRISDPGPERQAIARDPVRPAQIPSATVSPDFRTFVPDVNPTLANGLWTVLGTWTVVSGDSLMKGYGLRPGTPASLFYLHDADCGDMAFDLVMTPEKTEGTGFSIPGSPADHGERNLHADIYIKYDPRTRNGYALRFWRTTQSASKCRFQFYRIEDGVGSPLDERQVLSGVFRPTTHLTLTATGTTLTARATNTVDREVLDLQGTIRPNRFGGAGVSWPRGSSNVYSRLEISYPINAGLAPASN